MRLYTYVLSLCVIYIIECRPNVRTLDRPKPNVLTLDLVFIYVLTPVGSKLDVLTPGHSDSQPGSCFVYSLQVFPSGTVSTICLFVDLK